MAAFGQARFGAGRRNRFVHHCGVPQSGYYFLNNQSFTTGTAVAAFGKTGFSTGWSNSFVNHSGVTECRNHFLSNQYFTTDRAVASFGQACGSTGRCHSCIGCNGVAQSGDHTAAFGIVTAAAVCAGLRAGLSAGGRHLVVANHIVSQSFLQNFTADGTYLIFSAGSSCSRRVPQSRNYFLNNQSFTTSAAMAAFGQARFGAGRSNRFVHHCGVPQSGYYFLSNQCFTTSAAMAAFGQARFSAGRSNRFVHHRGVPQSGYYFLNNQSFTTSATMAAFGQTGFGAGRSNRFVHHRGVPQSGYYFLSNQCFTTSAAMAAFGQTGGSTGRCHSCIGHQSVPQSGNHFLGDEHFTAVFAVLAFGQAGGGTGGYHSCIGHFLVAISRNLFGSVVTANAGDRFYTCIGTGCFDCYFFFQDMVANTNPLAVCISVGCIRHFASVHHSAVSIQQLGRGQGNFHITSILNQLMRNRLGTGLEIDLCTFVTYHIGTAGGGVDETFRGIDGAPNNNLCIHQIGFGTSVPFAGSIDDGNQLLIGRACVGAPFIGVVDIDADTFTQGTGCFCAHLDDGAGQHANILIDADTAVKSADSHVGVDGQLIILGIDGAGTHSHIDGRNFHITVGLHDEAVSAAVVFLHNIAGGQVEHRVAAGDKGNSRAEVRTGHIDGGVSIFRSAGIDGHCHLNILDIVLGQGEHAIVHIGTLGAAAEVRNLKQLIDGTAIVYSNRAGAGNVAVSIQCAVNGNDTVALHAHKAHIADGCSSMVFRALGVSMLTGNADCTVNGQLCAVGQSQSAVGCGHFIVLSFYCLTNSLGGIHGVSAIEGNQQRDTDRNGVVTCRQRCIVQQNKSLVRTVCCCHFGGLIKTLHQFAGTNLIIIQLAQAQQTGALALLRSSTHSEPGGTAVVLGKSSLDSHIGSGL